MWRDDRFANHAGSPLLKLPAPKAIAANFDYLASAAGSDLSMAYLYRTVNKGDSRVDNTGMAKLLGCVGTEFNAYGMGGKANVPMITCDPDGVTLRVGRPLSANWLEHIHTDPATDPKHDVRPKYTLPVVDPTRVGSAH